MSLWHEAIAIDAKFNGQGRKFLSQVSNHLTNRPIETCALSIKRSFYAILSWKRWDSSSFVTG